jgi:uncharacterized protein (DUF983 family)
MDTIDAPRSAWDAVLKGFAQTCPDCGRGRLFGKYLKVNPECPQCGAMLHNHRADDAPPYFTILAVGHIIVPGMLMLEKLVEPPSWVQSALWVPLTLVLSLLLLPRIKGALIGFQWAHRMHGFGGAVD